MTDITTAVLARELTPFEGRSVTRSRIEIPGAAGGLQDALDVEPVELHHGEERFLLMKVETVKVRHDPIKDSDSLARVHVLKPVAGMSTFVDATIAEKMLNEEVDRIRVAREEAAGVTRLPMGPDPTDLDGVPFGQTAESDDEDEDEDDGA